MVVGDDGEREEEEGEEGRAIRRRRRVLGGINFFSISIILYLMVMVKGELLPSRVL